MDWRTRFKETRAERAKSTLPQRLLAGAIAGLVLFVLLYASAYLAKEITAIPLLVLAAPVALFSQVTGVSHPVIVAVLGVALFYFYGVVLDCWAKRRGLPVGCALVVVVHGACLCAVAALFWL
jgi:hypothetical protein